MKQKQRNMTSPVVSPCDGARDEIIIKNQNETINQVFPATVDEGLNPKQTRRQNE